MSARCVVALGANLGDRLAALRSATVELDRSPGITVLGCSPVVASRAVGGPEDSPDYLNAVLELKVDLTPEETLRACQRIENEHGRRRDVRWGPRTLDMDIVWFEGVEQQDAHLILPHPRAHERAFVLVPWARLDPHAMLGRYRVSDLAQRAPDLSGLTTTDFHLCESGLTGSRSGTDEIRDPSGEPDRTASDTERS